MFELLFGPIKYETAMVQLFTNFETDRIFRCAPIFSTLEKTNVVHKNLNHQLSCGYYLNQTINFTYNEFDYKFNVVKPAVLV